MICRDCYQRGLYTAYGETYRASDDEDHRAGCGSDSCRACEVVAEVAESAIQGLSVWMTDAEAEIFMRVLIQISERRLAGK